MEKIMLHPDFKDFLKLLNSHSIKYLVVGGYAVGCYGYPRATGDMDIWIAIDSDNARKVKKVFCEFGMPADKVSEELFLEKDKVIRMGNPPVQIEVITGASGVDFSECYSRREVIDINGIPINLFHLRISRKTRRHPEGIKI